MEDSTTKTPLFKKLDQAIFESIDKFKTSPNYSPLQDFYNGLEEEQQKLFKAFCVLMIFLLPLVLLSFLWFQNQNLKADLEVRKSIISNANEILAQNKGIRDVRPNILSSGPIESEDMMTSRLSSILAGAGIEISKIKIKDFNATAISEEIFSSEAKFSFSNMTTDELMNLFSTLIQREKFRIKEVDIQRNADTNNLQGQFHAFHYSIVTIKTEE